MEVGRSVMVGLGLFFRIHAVGHSPWKYESDPFQMVVIRASQKEPPQDLLSPTTLSKPNKGWRSPGRGPQKSSCEPLSSAIPLPSCSSRSTSGW